MHEKKTLQSDKQTDGRMDGRTDRRSALQSRFVATKNVYLTDVVLFIFAVPNLIIKELRTPV